MKPVENRGQRLFGLAVVLGLHAFVLSALWHYRLLPVPDAETLFVDLVSQDRPPPPPPEPPRTVPPPPEAKPEPPPPVELPKPVQLVVETPVVMAPEPVAPPPPPPPPAPPPPPPPAPPAPPVKIANAVTLAGELSVSCPQRAAPRYPNISKRLGEQGRVVLRVELNESGEVALVRIEHSSGIARLDEAAVATVKTWRCNPAQRDGVAVRSVALQPFNFVLEGH